MIHWPLHLLWIAFGPATWGAGGNMLAWALCGGLAFAWLHAKEKARHLALKAQAERHHQELLAAAQAHHNALRHLAVKHQAELLDRADAHHEALKAHVTAASKAAPRTRKEAASRD